MTLLPFQSAQLEISLASTTLKLRRGLTAISGSATVNITSKPSATFGAGDDPVLSGAVTPLNITPNGLIDQGPLINAAIAALLLLNPKGGEILLPAGDMGISTPVDLRSGVTLVGGASPLMQTQGTRLIALGDNACVRSIGASIGSRVLAPCLRRISLWGRGSGSDVEPVLDIRNTSYFRAERCSFGNTLTRALWIRGGWDCRFNDCEVTFAGKSDGSAPAIDLDSPNGGAFEYTNQIFFNQLRMESYFGTAIASSGTSTNEIFLTDCKLETTFNTSAPTLNFVNANNLSFQNIQITYGGNGAFPAIAAFTNCQMVRGRLSMERVGSSATVASYVSLTTTTGVDLDLAIAIGAGPEPTGGFIYGWDGTAPNLTNVRAQTSLNAPVGGVTVGPTASLRQVATRCKISPNLETGNRYFQQTIPHVACSDITMPSIVIPNFYTSAAGELSPGGASTVLHAAIVWNGNVKQFTFGGSASGVAANGGMLTSDRLRLGFTIPRGAKFFVYLDLDSPSGRPWLSAPDYSVTGGSLIRKSASPLSDLSANPLSNPGGDNHYVPLLAILDYSSAPCTALCGDSRVYGFDPALDGYQVTGIFGRAFKSMATIGLGTPSEAINTVANTPATWANRQILANYCTTIVGNWGINDLIASTTAANVLAYIRTFIAAQNGKPVIWTTMDPRSTSTDFFATIANQTATAIEAARQTVNSTIRGMGIGAAGYWDTAAFFEGAYGKWKGAERVVADAAITSGAAALTSATANFNLSDVNKYIVIAGAGVAAAALQVQITAVSSATAVTVSANASTTVSGAVCSIGLYTADGLHATGFGNLALASAGVFDLAAIK